MTCTLAALLVSCRSDWDVDDDERGTASADGGEPATADDMRRPAVSYVDGRDAEVRPLGSESSSALDAAPTTELSAADAAGPLPTAADAAEADATPLDASAPDASPPPITCDDQLMNAAETDVDCGGSGSCPRCALGKKCAKDSDCVTGMCSGAVCATPTFAWRLDAFGACNASSCGVGVQTRGVRCMRSDGVLASDGACSMPRPAETQSCTNTQGCSWYVGSYGTCSARCGGGTAARAVYCRDAAGLQVPNSWCVAPAPAPSMSCNLQACVVYVAGEPTAAMGPCWTPPNCLGGYPAYPSCPAGYVATRSEQACGNPNLCGSNWALCIFFKVHSYGCASNTAVMGVSSRECTYQ